MEPYFSPNNPAGVEEEQSQSRPSNQCPIIMSSGHPMSRRSAHSSPYRSTHPHPSLPQSDARRLEQQIYAGMQPHPSQPGGISRGWVPFFGRHSQPVFERGEICIASSATHPPYLRDPSTMTAELQRGMLNGRSPPSESLRRHYPGQRDDPLLHIARESGGSLPDRAAELGLVGSRATSHPVLLPDFVAASVNPTPSRARSQAPGEDSFSAEYGSLTHFHGPLPPQLGSQPSLESYTELDPRRPIIVGPTAASLSGLPSRILEKSFVRDHGSIPPSFPAPELNPDASGHPTYGYSESTRRSPPSYPPAEEEEEEEEDDEEEDMPPLPPLPSIQPLPIQTHQDTDQSVQGENRCRREEVQPQMEPCRKIAAAIVAQEAVAIEAEIFHFPRPLGTSSDAKYLTEFHCFLRSNLIEVFCATVDDINAPRRGRKKPVTLGQVGVRCMSCACAARKSGATEKRNGATYYPTTIASIYNSVMLIQQRHFSECKAISAEIRAEYSRLKLILGRSGAAKDYWEDSARKIGLVDTPDGIYHQPSSPLTSTAAVDHGSVAPHEQNVDKEPVQPLVQPGDRDLATEYSFFIMQQMTPCTFAESDRLGKRRSHRCGFPGITCIHCAGKNGSGRYFPSSVKTFADASKTINVLHNHILKCPEAPKNIKRQLQGLKNAHHAEKDAMRHGSQKQFFDNIWSRLHNTTTSTSPSSATAASSPHPSLGSTGGSPDSCSFGSLTSSSTLAVSPTDTAPASAAAPASASASAGASVAPAISREVDSSISDVALIMLEMKSPVVWTDEVHHVESI